MGKNYTAGRFLNHLINARRWDTFHSPFLFDLFTQCCNEHARSPEFEAIEACRKELLTFTEKIKRTDFGAGSATGNLGDQVPIADIARHALSHPFQCRFLFRLVQFMKPQSILELGTSLGISTAYLAAAAPEGFITTVEGDPNVARIARQTFEKLELANIELHSLLFRTYLEDVDEMTPDLIFLDGHHESKALVEYYDILEKRIRPETIIVIDDIYWSKDMTEGWNELIRRPTVTQSVDCFHFGLLFFSPDFIGREHHKIRLPLSMLTRKN